MEDFITVSGKTVEDAITEAQILLGVASDDLDYEVIEKGSNGIFGIGSKKAVIKARKKEEEPVIIEETVVEEKVVMEEPAFDTAKKPATENTAAPAVDDTKVNEEKPAKVESEPEEEKEVMDVDLAISTAKNFLGTILEDLNMDVELSTSANINDNTLEINMIGENMGILIGKRGQTLDALQYLTSLAVNKVQNSYVHVKLDTENYREKRKATLENLARNIASKVKRTRKNVVLEPMTPYERRIIHFALQNDKQVTTHSEGEEPYRKVVVSLKKHK